MTEYTFEYQIFRPKQPMIAGFKTVTGLTYWTAYWKARRKLKREHYAPGINVIIKLDY